MADSPWRLLNATELRICQRKLERLRDEVRALNHAMSNHETVRLREELVVHRKALSFIANAPRASEMTADELRAVARTAVESTDGI
jgi:hypothetical protein